MSENRARLIKWGWGLLGFVAFSWRGDNPAKQGSVCASLLSNPFDKMGVY